MQATGERWAILGGSRGLGQAFDQLAVHAGVVTRVWSRTSPQKWDFTDESQWEQGLADLRDFNPTRIFCFAGGGPHGLYSSKQWKDHLWSVRLNFLFPARLLHEILQRPKEIRQVVLIGSAIAEDKPDPLAASYAAGKHALRGLVSSIQAESKFDVRLFSPPYMQTSLLPANSKPVREGLAEPAGAVAQRLYQSLF